MSQSRIVRWLKRQRVGVLMGGLSAERSISLKTGNAIWRSLKRSGISAYAIDARQDIALQLKRRRISAAYIALHGPGGEDGAVQGLLEWLKIPYTGCGILASALAMDKIASKRLFDQAGLPTARWLSMLDMPSQAIGSRVQKMGYPVVVKPARQGSAIGVSIVNRSSQLAAALRDAGRFGPDILIEKFISGVEITVGVLGSQTLPIIEIVPSDREFYDFHAKYAPGGSRHILPARISKQAAQRAAAMAQSACHVLNTRAVARVDLIVASGNRPFILEVNTIPGMTETSLLPEAARAAGLDFDALVLKIAEYSFGA